MATYSLATEVGSPNSRASESVLGKILSTNGYIKVLF